jgi:hypothetical protein
LVPQGGWGEIPAYYDVCECDPGRQCERTEFVDQCEVFGCLVLNLKRVQFSLSFLSLFGEKHNVLYDMRSVKFRLSKLKKLNPRMHTLINVLRIVVPAIVHCPLSWCVNRSVACWRTR